MSQYDAPFEIHVHGDVPLRTDVTYAQLQEALKPLWTYAGAKSLADGAESAYEEEPGIKFDAQEHLLPCAGRSPATKTSASARRDVHVLNELAEEGAAIEVTFYDAEFDEEEGDARRRVARRLPDAVRRPHPAAIMQVQRDLLVQDVVNLMERHFDGAELGGVVAEIDKLFSSASTRW
jgi:hypothetical protein